MSRQDAVQSWWDGLTAEQQNEFRSSSSTGAPSAGMQQSMEQAGLVKPGKGKIPKSVLQYLAGKGSSGSGDSIEGGKMRH